MAEGLAFAASIVAFIQLADRVGQLSKTFIDAMKGEPGPLKAVQAEMAAMTTLLNELHNHHDASDPRTSAVIERATDQPIKTCHDSVQMLETELSKLSISPAHANTGSSKRQRIKQSVKWATGGEMRVNKIVADLVAQKATLSLALQSSISRDVGEVKDFLTASQRHDIANWLQRTNPSDIHNRSVNLYEPHTGNWVFRSTEWSDFVQGHTRSLWIHGIPGAGKTILCSNIVQHLRRLQDRRTGWVYYYCYFGRNQDETEPLLRWIIVQLCQQARYVPKKLSSAYQSGDQLGIDDLLSILEAILEVFDTAFVTIDALDESMPYTNLLACLNVLMTETRFNKLRLLMTSRQYLDIEQTIKPHAVSFPMLNRYVEEDLRIYITSQLQSHSKFRAWPTALIEEVNTALVRGAKGMFRWAVCQVDILGRLKSQSDVRKALTELPETLDETYERIILAIPREYRSFARTALAILAAQSELGERTMTAEVLLAMVLRTLNISADHFYDIYDIREFCGCLVTFLPTRVTSYDPNSKPMHFSGVSDDATQVVMAHYTVKEFLYAERTAHKFENHVSSFALQEDTVIRRWADLVMEVAVSARLSDRRISDNSMEDYCVNTGHYVVKLWEAAILNNDKVVSDSLDFLNPAAPHHSRLPDKSILEINWYSPPVNPRIAALAECAVQDLWLLAAAALKDLNAQQIIETSVAIHYNDKRPHSTRPKMIEMSLPLWFSTTAQGRNPFRSFREANDNPQHKTAKLLSTVVGWESLLLAATVEHNHASAAGSFLEWVILQGPDLNACPCRLTALQAAIQLRDYEAVKLLLDSGADANAVGATRGYSLSGAGLDEGRACDSPLRMLKTAPCTFRAEVAQRVRREVRRGGTTKAKLEGLLLDAGARDFTAKEIGCS
ncbi:hypothetical protein B0I37DRAFT_194123 [Chaetomium sp. MPI-CAGE-AT-0009]|nr:hypothetical protein B0I37DRAFT_194123 [Chaetomium sp. MPI-CAGE-AT-0009]